ncbi:MAG: delta(1)-pyrroline-2-carboxylate reductase family protein [Burkholderiales bacterium]
MNYATVPGTAPQPGAVLDAAQTAARLPWAALVAEIAAVLQDPGVQVVPRLVLPLPLGASLFVMPAHDARLAIAKLISFTPANAALGQPTIQGDVLVFDIASGQRCLMLHGPTVTARRTAAVSLLAAQRLAPNPRGPLLIVGAGVQGQAHLEAFAQGLAVQEVVIASRADASAQALAQRARALGLQARVTPDANAALADCPLVVTATPAKEIVLRTLPRADAFVAAVGAFTPQMRELDTAFCQHCAQHGQVVMDTPDAAHEAGDLLQAGLVMAQLRTLAEVITDARGAGKTTNQNATNGPVLFKSCGWAGWDLAAARLAMASALP